jgi:hypothetical protein
MDNMYVNSRACSVTVWSLAGLRDGVGEALRKEAAQLHLAVPATSLAALPAKPPITICYWEKAGADITSDGTVVWRPDDHFAKLCRDASVATRAACLPPVSCSRPPSTARLVQ